MPGFMPKMMLYCLHFLQTASDALVLVMPVTLEERNKIYFLNLIFLVLGGKLQKTGCLCL